MILQLPLNSSICIIINNDCHYQQIMIVIFHQDQEHVPEIEHNLLLRMNNVENETMD